AGLIPLRADSYSRLVCENSVLLGGQVFVHAPAIGAGTIRWSRREFATAVPTLQCFHWFTLSDQAALQLPSSTVKRNGRYSPTAWPFPIIPPLHSRRLHSRGITQRAQRTLLLRCLRCLLLRET